MLAYFKQLGFEKPTAMQEDYLAQEALFSILLSNTGSGKTLSFLVKLAGQLEQAADEDTVLILSPTRELAIQLYEVLGKLRLPYHSVLCYGGHSFKNERLQLAEKPKIVVGTPGRILDHYERSTPGLSAFNILIIDEYDKTLELGFQNELEQIAAHSGKIKAMQLVSATEIEELPAFIRSHPFETYNYLVGEKPEIAYYQIGAKENDKLHALASFLSTLPFSPSIVFCTHREAVERIAQHLSEYGKSCVSFHGGLDQLERERALIKFKNGTVDCLVATDLASRGLDIPEIEHIIHYQYPHTFEDFTHRNGRTARMKKSGKVYLIHSESEPLPDYTKQLNLGKIELPEKIVDYPESDLVTLYLNVGRKQKIRKVDIVGFFSHELQLPFDQLGMIFVQDSYSYVALKKESYQKYKQQLEKIKIKKMNARLNLCR